MSGTLHIVGTPIGNLGDMSERAMETLRASDLVAAEDTRHTRQLLSHFDIHTELVSFHEHSREARVQELVDALEEGKSVALVSDAGMPLVSDPGYVLVQACCKRNIPIDVVPGPSAVTAVIALSGIDCRQFVFGGFLSAKRTARSRELSQLCEAGLPVVLYESPNRVLDLIEDVCSVLSPEARVCVAREMTKRFETTVRGAAAEVLSLLQDTEPRGEYAIVVDARVDKRQLEDDEIREKIASLVADGMSNRDAAKYAAVVFGIPKKRAYQVLVEMEENI